MVVTPAKVFEPDKVLVPVPILVNPPAPLRTPAIRVLKLPLTVKRPALLVTLSLMARLPEVAGSSRAATA